MKFLAIIEATIREGIARKTILGMFIVSTLSILIAIFIFQLDAVQHGLLSPPNIHVERGQTAGPQGSGGASITSRDVALAGLTLLDGVWAGVAMMLLLLSIFVGTFVTASFVTSIMEKGTIDLYLSKPVPRWQYLVGRYVGGVLIILSEVAYLILGLWVVAGLSLGAWNPRFLYSILLITLGFAGVYSLVTLFGILTRSSWFAAIIALAIFILATVIIPIGLFIDRLLNGMPTEGVLTSVSRGIRFLVPTSGIRGVLSQLLLNRPVDVGPVFITLALVAGYLALSSWAFSRKEF